MIEFSQFAKCEIRRGRNDPADYFKRVDPGLLYPRFRDAYLQCLINCEKKNALYIVTSGYRSYDEQARLFNQGRSAASIELKQKIVTNSKAGRSYHNFGLACDAVRDFDVHKWGVQPDWSSTAYITLADEAKALGLNPGFYFKSFKGDYPHVQFKIPTFLGLRDIQLKYQEFNNNLTKLWLWMDKFIK